MHTYIAPDGQFCDLLKLLQELDHTVRPLCY
jgi:hypothetical protein